MIKGTKMETPSVVLGDEEPAGAAFAASGCSSMLDFLSSPLFCNSAVQRVNLFDRILYTYCEPGWLYISVKDVRDAEEAREAGSFARFLHALPLSFTGLSVYAVLKLEEMSDFCRAIGSPNCTLLDLAIEWINSAHTDLFKDALFNNTSLRGLLFDTSGDFSADQCGLIPALTRLSPCSSITHLHLDRTRVENASGILTLLAHNVTISLTNFSLRADGGDSDTRQVGTMLSTNTSLHSFSLEFFDLTGEEVRFLFASLEKNAHLSSLSLLGCRGPDWPTSASFVLDSLRVNGMLGELDLTSTPLSGKSEAAIQAQLARNRQRVEQRAALKAEGSALVKPTTIRLFLCGLPYSGKTTLSRSLVRSASNFAKGLPCGLPYPGKTTLSRSLVRWETPASSSAKCLPCAPKSRLPERTRGIQLSTIEKDGVKVSLWDMAGQEEYYAFHDQMFPDLSSDATPSLFLFVWNPIQLADRSTGQEMKDERGNYVTKTLDMFEHEFRYQHMKGFFPPQFLENLLESKVDATMVRSTLLKAYSTIFLAKATSSPTIKGEALVKLLIGLQLACRQHDGQVNSDIFIPASLCTTPRKHVDPCSFLKGDEGNIKTFMGRRLKCKDSVCTFFTPGIFSFLQVTFNNDLSGVEVTLDEDVIAFCQNGVKVLVEFCKHEGRDHFVDVLIHSRLDLDNTIGRWAYEEIFDKMESICAEPRGIQGVQLVYEVIRPRSVKEFVCMEQRICAAVSLEKLCTTLSHALEKRGSQPDCLKSVFYDWPPMNDSDCVIDLIGNVETLKVFKEYRNKFSLDVEEVLGINIGKEVCSTSEPDQKKAFSSSISGIERAAIYDEVQEVRKDIQRVRKDIQEVHKVIQKLVDDVQKLRNDVLPEVLQKVQELLTFAQDGEVGRLPRLFVVTRNDAGFVRKLVSAMVPGLQNVRLELLCEHRSKPHLVTEQRGISFATLEDGLLKQGLPYINMFLKLAGMAVKVGAHVAAGIGNTIPDFSRLIALIVDTPEFPSLSTYMGVQAPGQSRINFQESQQWLFDVLSKHNCGSSTGIHEVFGLKRVRYRDSHVGWLCHKHCCEGEVCPI